MISIITPTFNSQNTIKDCLDSIYNQIDCKVQHIIVDGKSKDNTLEIIKDNPFQNRIIVSEPDNGIYDAMNKGINLATGDIVGILNSDDLYSAKDILSAVEKAFSDMEVDLLYGNIKFVDRTDIYKVVRKWISSEYKERSFFRGWHPPHPSFFVRRQVYEKYGLFRKEMNISADFELMLRFFEKYKLKSIYLDRVIVTMRYGGESTKSFKNIIDGNRDCIRSFKINGLKVNPLYPVIRLIPKVLQFIKK